MGRTAVLFPGQGVQTVGMGRDLYEASAAVREIFERANEVLGYELKSLVFEGPQDKLTRTTFAQPALLTVNHCFFTLATQRGLPFQGTAGHSLGEYNALVAAGSLSFDEALAAVKERASLMEEVGLKTRGTMAAILALEEGKLQEICAQASEAGLVEITNYNCPGQLVVSGEVPAVERVCELVKKAGAKPLRLRVGGAFHSALMQEAADRFGEMLRTLPLAEPRCDLYLNVTGGRETEPAIIRERLRSQLRSPVRWEKLIRNMLADGLDSFVELGPGSVLTGLVSRISRDTRKTNINSLASIQALPL